jgi:GNAT superfamily N-acetyltransferase
MDDADDIAEILAEAFGDDPVMTWTFGNTRPFRTVFRELARGIYLKNGFAHLIDGAAATLWLPAGAAIKLPRMNELRIAGAALRHSGFGAIRRAFTAADVMEKHHPETPHYYLFAVGVRKAAQGRGLGGAILREGLLKADAEGAPAYLENSNPKNTPLYERLGFRPLAPLPLPAEAPPLLAMLRPARNA